MNSSFDKLKKKGVISFFWDLSGKIANQVATLFVGIILARLLDPSDFGLIAIIMIFIGFTHVFTDVGLSSALIQRRHVIEVHYTSVFYFNVFVASLFCIITFFLADEIGIYYPNTQIPFLLKCLSPIFIIQAISSVQSTIHIKNLNHKVIAKSKFISALIGGVIGCFLAYNNFGVWSLLWQSLSNALLYSIIIWRLSYWRPSLLFSFNALKQLWGFGFKIFLAGLIEAIFTRADSLVIAKLTTLESLAFFQKARQLNKLTVKYSSGSLMSVLFPVLSELQNTPVEFNRVVFKGLNILCLLTFLLIGMLYLISNDIVVLLYTSKWETSSYYLQILLLSSFAYPISALLINVIKSRGHAKRNLYLQLIKKVFHVINFANAFAFGVSAYLYGLIPVALFSIITNIYFVNSDLRMRLSFYYAPLFTQMVISFLSVVVTMQITSSLDLGLILNIPFKVLIFLALFFPINFMFKTRSFFEMKSMLLPVIKRFIS
ncbi:hypothetical protein CW745_10400 [Psychromonas sp. psych-6C06]|uniref:lipopolysaccharide biosynthesis protein n=1 Tax=Psychromonas sp. psych-6C06 TaxID=2058089 RepID=UPI000C31D921|nr:lipopolysaccharide biosynthesis protein [Psychromonas sp. psych-6C06]PKF61721.1 hypothetical protein CW745_10400 [Psychromonas sp. psych-6C06]